MKQLKLFVQIMCLVLLIGTSCEKSEVTPAQPNKDLPSDPLTLASITQENGGVTNFLQLNDGSIMIHTVYDMDGSVSVERQNEYASMIQSLISSNMTYDVIYKKLAGNAIKNEYVAVLKDADILYRKKLEETKNVSYENVDVDKIISNFKANVSASTNAAGRTEACKSSSDWGAQWFLNNFSMLPAPVSLPNGGTFYPPLPSDYSSAIATNVTGWSESMAYKSFYQVNVMAADYTYGATVDILTGVDVIGCNIGGCTVIPRVSHFDIKRRTVQFFAYHTGGWSFVAQGISPCPRIHVARLKDVL